MYLWDIKALKKKLVARSLTEAQVFAYFFAVLTLDTLVYQLSAIFSGPEPAEIWDYVEYAVTVIFTVGGTLVVYVANGGASGRQFLPRYFPLMWVLTIRFLVWMIPILIGVGILMFGIAKVLLDAEVEDPDFTSISRVLLVASWAWFLVFYYRLAVHMRDVAKAV